MAHRWKQTSRSAKVIAGLAVMALLALLPSQFATGQAPLTLEPEDAGYIRLQMNSGGNRFRYFAPGDDVNEAAIQSFKASNCVYTPVSPASGFNLVGLSPTPGTSKVGYSTSGSGKFGLGINTSEGTGKCTQTNTPNEKLTLSLLNGAGDPNLEGMYVDYMELDIEAKFNAVISIELWRDGQQVGDTLVEDCTSSGSDCGPDSTDGDNFRLRVPAEGTVLFDEVRLYATGGSGAAVTLEAGADGTLAWPGGLGESLSTKDSIFHLVSLGEGVLSCDAGDGSAFAFEGATVTVERQSFPDNPDLNPDGTECIPINYELTRDLNTVEFLKDPTQDPNASFHIEVNAWDPEEAANPIPASKVYPPEPLGQPLVWCDGTAAAPVMPAGDHFWCLFRQSAELVGFNETTQVTEMQVTESVLLEGDARIIRP